MVDLAQYGLFVLKMPLNTCQPTSVDKVADSAVKVFDEAGRAVKWLEDVATMP